ncbi:hypothetical protein ACQKNS_22720 [Peribacillus sp. NPDC094092]|uniref:hypothetical protein n=1 Tax=Peribacillus sp. NPDC094092 TaxID=3390611 RepID=UPI003D02D69F
MKTKRIKTNMDQAIWLKQVLEQLPEEEINLLGLSLGYSIEEERSLCEFIHIQKREYVTKR